MLAELTTLDGVFLGLTLLLVLVGGGIGISSQLSALAAFVVAPLVGYICWGIATAGAAALGCAEGTGGTIVAGLIDLVIALVAFGLVRLLVKNFVQKCLGGLSNVLAGAFVGLIASLAIFALMVGVGVSRPGEYARGFCAERSTLVNAAAVWLDRHVQGWSS